MSDQEHYNTILPAITAMSPEEYKTPTIPMEHYLQEANDLFHIAAEDKEYLIERGMNWRLVDELPIRVGAARYAESTWRKSRYTKDEAQVLWGENAPDAFKLRNLLLEEFRFAFRKHSQLSQSLNSIADGRTNADMIQDLADLSALGRDNIDLLTLTNFDMTILEKAQKSAEALSPLLGATTADTYSSNEVKVLRDAAYTHLKGVIDEIRDYGQFVFRKAERKKAYASNYMRRKNSSRKKKDEAPVAE